MRRYLPAFNSLPSSLQRLRVIGTWWPSVLTSNPLAFFPIGSQIHIAFLRVQDTYCQCRCTSGEITC